MAADGGRKSGVAAYGEGGDADAYAFDGAQCRPAGFGGGSGGDDVVDEEYVLAFQLFGLSDGKDSFHIVESLDAVFVRLRFGVLCAYQVAAGDGAAEGLHDAFAQPQALVVSASAFLALVQWHGDDDVDVVELSALGDFCPQLPSHQYGQLFVAVVFDLVQDALCFALFPEKQ